MRLFTLLSAGLIVCSLNVKAQSTPPKYTIKGVVSYFFNTNYGDKPDTGAKAYVLTDEDMKTLNTSYEQIYRYLIAYSSTELSSYKIRDAVAARGKAPRAQREEADKAIETAKQDQIQWATRLKQSGDSVFTAIIHLEMEAWTPKRVTSDGNGVFSKKVAPGKYYLFVISAHRQHVTKAEYGGQIAVKKVEVKDDDIEIPFKFGL